MDAKPRELYLLFRAYKVRTSQKLSRVVSINSDVKYVKKEMSNIFTMLKTNAIKCLYYCMKTFSIPSLRVHTQLWKLS